MMETKNLISLGAVGLIGLIGLATANPIYFVQSGEKAVIKRLGVVGENVINEGMHFKTPYVDSVCTINVKPQKIDGDAVTYTKDNQPIDVKFNVIYSIPDNGIQDAVVRYNNDPMLNFAHPKIMDAIKAIGGKYTASDFVTKRELIRRDIVELSRKAVIDEQTNRVAIRILDIPVTNVDFDDQYEQAIKAKQVAQQEAQKAEYELQQARVDTQAAVAKAEGEARALTVKAQAIAKSPQVLRLNEIAKWDGHYPLNAKVIGGGATIVDTTEDD